MNQKIGEMKKKTAVVTDVATIIILTTLTILFAMSHNFKSAESIITDDIIKPIVLDVIPVTRLDIKKTDVVYKVVPFEGVENEDIELPGIGDVIEDFNKIPDTPVNMPQAPGFVEAIDDIVDVAVVAEAPQLIDGSQSLSANLVYPPMAKKAGINGKALIQFVVDTNGKPINIRIMQERPLNMGFGESALKAVAAVRFTPGMQGDQPVKVRMSLPVNFQIK